MRLKKTESNKRGGGRRLMGTYGKKASKKDLELNNHKKIKF